ncbi:MAG TPA: hypothetical protein VF359_02020 [Anaerolineales bacterium]
MFFKAAEEPIAASRVAAIGSIVAEAVAVETCVGMTVARGISVAVASCVDVKADVAEGISVAAASCVEVKAAVAVFIWTGVCVAGNVWAKRPHASDNSAIDISKNLRTFNKRLSFLTD